MNPRPTEPESVALSTELRALTPLDHSTLFCTTDNRQGLRVYHPAGLQSGGGARLINL